jgi:ADP-ribose pyrophosphatase YjhB (NUDIX family)
VKNILGNIYRSLHMPKNLQLFVMRLLHDKFLVGVTGIILNDKKEILVFKHTYRSHQWSLPGGYLTAGEHPQEAIEREIKEESGFTICIDEALKIRTDRESARLDLCYIGTYIGGEFTPTKEVSEYGFFSMDNLPLLRKNQLFLINEVLKDHIDK